MVRDTISPSDIAKYFLLRTQEDGELVSPLKMQKMVYFAYVLYLLKKKGKEKLFSDKIEAWSNGPVIPALYKDLKKYGSSPINADKYVNVSLNYFAENYPSDILETLDETYERCASLTAFELTAASHQQKAWLEARRGLAPGEPSNSPILDRYILEQYAH